MQVCLFGALHMTWIYFGGFLGDMVRAILGAMGVVCEFACGVVF